MITIHKVKSDKNGGLEVHYSETFTTDTQANVTVSTVKNSPYAPHADLVQQLDAMRVHLALLCEQKPDTSISTGGELIYDSTPFKVTGYTIGGEDEHEGVTLVGQKKLANNRSLNLVAPFTKWQDEHNGYGGADELFALITNCNSEVGKYLGGKAAPEAQASFDFGMDNAA